MRSRQAVNLFLGLAVAAATLAVWIDTRPPPAPARLVPADAPPSRIRALQDDRLVLELTRTAERWQLQVPFRRAADPARVRHLLSLAQAPLGPMYAASEVDLAGAGLAPAQWQLEFDDARIGFGLRAPLSESRYLQFGDQVTLLADNWLPLLQAGAGAFADTQLSPFGPDLQSIETPLARIEREPDGWNGAQATPVEAAAMAQAWMTGRAMAVRRLQAGSPDLGHIELRGRTGDAQRYQLIQVPEGLALQNAEGGYELVVDAELAERLLQPAATDGAD